MNDASSEPTTREPLWPRVANGLVVLYFGLVIGASIPGILARDFTDAELAYNLVDTWQATVIGGYFVIASLVVLLVPSVFLWRGSKGRDRTVLGVTTLLGFLALAAIFASLSVLTARTERLQGMDLTGLFYFF